MKKLTITVETDAEISDDNLHVIGRDAAESEKIIITEITCKSSISNEVMIEFLKFVRKATELRTENYNLRAWWD